MKNIKKFKKEIIILILFTFVTGIFIIFLLQQNVEGGIFYQKTLKETEDRMLSNEDISKSNPNQNGLDIDDKGIHEVRLDNSDNVENNIENSIQEEVNNIEEKCFEDIEEQVDSQDDIYYEDNKDSDNQEVIDGSWQSNYTVTPEILEEYSVLWESGNIKKKLNVAQILQNPELPSGCEVTSLTAACNYLGYNVDKMTMANQYLDMGEIGITNPYKAFVGTPDDDGAYGCFAPVVINCANKFLEDTGKKYTAYDYSNNSLKYLFNQIDLGYPVVIWATIDMRDTYPSAVWNIDGEEIYFPANEHCLLLTGYDYEESVVYIMDPMNGNVTYDMALFNYRYNQMGNQAVVIK